MSNNLRSYVVALLAITAAPGCVGEAPVGRSANAPRMAEVSLAQMATSRSDGAKAQSNANVDYVVELGTVRQLRSAKRVDALRTIKRLARRTSIVILNEDHRRPGDRRFAQMVARALRPLGYNVLALEALVNDATDSRAEERMHGVECRGYLLATEGMYTSEPAFAEFVRDAIRRGYRLVSYEATSKPKPDVEDDIALREQEQAANFLRRVRLGRGEKVLVYVGLSHAAEAPIPSATGRLRRWFASRVKEASGIDPLTIDQATLDQDPVFRPSLPLYPLVSHSTARKSTILMSRGRPLIVGPYKEAVDLQVVHPVRRVLPRISSRRASRRPDRAHCNRS